MNPTKVITLTYHRLPDKTMTFPSVLLKEHEHGVVISHLLQPSQPFTYENTLLYDKNFLSIWYCPYDRWHDIGAIYDLDYAFKGYYCDLCTPIQSVANGVEMTDFFLDLWIFPDFRYLVLDQEEYQNAVQRGWLTPHQIMNVQDELQSLVTNVQSHRYPTPEIQSLITLPKNIHEIINTLSG